MVSTTMHLMPGVPIMKSNDLVNWEIISYVVDELKDSPQYDLVEGNVYGNGQWATSLRYHDGRFYVFFSTNKPHKSYIFSTKDPAGKWEKVMEMDKLYHDASLFFDDDGRVYLAWGSSKIKIIEVNSNLTSEQEGRLHATVIQGTERG